MAEHNISNKQCWHLCPKRGDRDSHDWCHVYEGPVPSKLDEWIKLCPKHRQDWDDIT